MSLSPLAEFEKQNEGQTMNHLINPVLAWAPVVLMLLNVVGEVYVPGEDARRWNSFSRLCLLAFGLGVLNLAMTLLGSVAEGPGWQLTRLGSLLAVLVQGLGLVIAGFSARYLEGEPGQSRYRMALAAVLASVHLLLLAQNFFLLGLAWSLIGRVLQPLLCFYPDRPFALLAAHKKRLADRLADMLLVVALLSLWRSSGSMNLPDTLPDLHLHVSSLVQMAACLLVLVAVLRTALLPVHGWLIQVMEAPTPVSALLHAGVVNLSGYVLVRMAPVLDQVAWARVMLDVFGGLTAFLAGLVMLTRVSIKVRLAWSTVAQMGFMLLECGLGLYSMAVLHMIGHSLYKAYAFLLASDTVRQTRHSMMQGKTSWQAVSLYLAPVWAVVCVFWIQHLSGTGAEAWPWWWSLMLGLMWAPLLWVRSQDTGRQRLVSWGQGIGMLVILMLILRLVHRLPLGVQDHPDVDVGPWVVVMMAFNTWILVLLQRRPERLLWARSWSYAGFYLDESYTRLALLLWPTAWVPKRDQQNLTAIQRLRSEP